METCSCCDPFRVLFDCWLVLLLLFRCVAVEACSQGGTPCVTLPFIFHIELLQYTSALVYGHILSAVETYDPVCCIFEGPALSALFSLSMMHSATDNARVRSLFTNSQRSFTSFACATLRLCKLSFFTIAWTVHFTYKFCSIDYLLLRQKFSYEVLH